MEWSQLPRPEGRVSRAESDEVTLSIKARSQRGL